MPHRPNVHRWRKDPEATERHQLITKTCIRCGLECRWDEGRDIFYRDDKEIGDCRHAQGPVPPCPGRTPARMDPDGRASWARLVARSDRGMPPTPDEREACRRAPRVPRPDRTMEDILVAWMELGYTPESIADLVESAVARVHPNLTLAARGAWANAATLVNIFSAEEPDSGFERLGDVELARLLALPEAKRVDDFLSPPLTRERVPFPPTPESLVDDRTQLVDPNRPTKDFYVAERGPVGKTTRLDDAEALAKHYAEGGGGQPIPAAPTTVFKTRSLGPTMLSPAGEEALAKIQERGEHYAEGEPGVVPVDPTVGASLISAPPAGVMDGSMTLEEAAKAMTNSEQTAVVKDGAIVVTPKWTKFGVVEPETPLEQVRATGNTLADAEAERSERDDRPPRAEHLPRRPPLDPDGPIRQEIKAAFARGEATVTETGVHELDSKSLRGEEGSRASAEVQQRVHRNLASGKDVTKPDVDPSSKGAATPKDAPTAVGEEDKDRGKQKPD